ncbi:MAG TPA: Fur family transcriptional regulator [Thermomicrobiales bacterium]|nr:Fur family transcriptional regulator [Thermomicrobiales bacterium]
MAIRTDDASGSTAISSWTSQRSPEEMAARLRAVGQRVTPQRLMILGAFAKAGEHLTAEEIVARVGPLSPAVNRSTVYRTLELFRDLGLISETDLGGGVRHFELLDDGRHHHLICRDCGAMLVLDDDLVQPLREGIQERYGFSPTLDHLALFGVCAYCLEHGEAGNGRDAESS